MSIRARKQWERLLSTINFNNLEKNGANLLTMAEEKLIDCLYYYIDEEDTSNTNPSYMDGSVDALCLIDARWEEYRSKHPFHIAIQMLQSSIHAILYCYKHYLNNESEYKKGFINTIINAKKYFNSWQFKKAFATYIRTFKTYNLQT